MRDRDKDDSEMLLSILIPTLEHRREQFEKLYNKLMRQINADSLENTVEIVYLRDNGEQSVGFKRNELTRRASGEFVAFVDDDDDVSDDYIAQICRAISENSDIDCIGIKGIITFAGRNPRTFIHSLRYDRYFTKGDAYFRPPYHLNPMRREIALKYEFEEVNYSEDIDWAMRICRDGALKREYFLDKVIYYYNSRRAWTYQLLLDRSEPVRHLLGLRFSNGVRLKRWLKSKIS